MQLSTLRSRAHLNVALLIVATCVIGDFSSAAEAPLTMRLWQADAPGATGDTEDDVPSITVYLPESETPTAALVIFPGGGYGHLAMAHEGHEIAQWANSMSMAGVIVSYRHRNRGYGHPAPMLDAQRAIRTVRSKAAQWNIDPKKVGVIGFSAGGHLATTVLTHFDDGTNNGDAVDELRCRPDFGIVSYAVIALEESYTHKGSQRNLLGENPDKDLLLSLSNEKQVTKNTPPCFVWHTAEDKVVPAENSLRFYSALVRSGSPSELHIFPTGRHGIGLATQFPGADAWPGLAQKWLIRRGILKAGDEQ